MIELLYFISNDNRYKLLYDLDCEYYFIICLDDSYISSCGEGAEDFIIREITNIGCDEIIRITNDCEWERVWLKCGMQETLEEMGR